MINEENKTELIDDYLSGALKDESLREFNEKLAHDEDFGAEVELQKSIVDLMPRVGKTELRSKLRSFHDEIRDEEPASPKVVKLWDNKVLRITLAAAASLLLILVSTLFILNLKNNTPALVFEKYYQAYPNEAYTNFRGQNIQPESEKAQAFMAYEKGDFPLSIQAFESMWKKEKDDVVLFYLGNAYLANGNTTKAITTFKEYLAHYKTFDDEAKWYLALSYLQEENNTKALPILRDLAQYENDFSKQAKEILKQLE